MKERDLSVKQVKAYSPRKPKRVEMSKAECQKLCASVGLDYLDGYEARVIEHVITDETVDRYGDIVRAKGVDFKNYRKNPTIQFAHDYASPPVGKSLKVWYDSEESNVKSYGLYFDNRVDTTGRSAVVFNFIASGALPACSIGFQPTETRRPKDAEERNTLGLGEYGVEFLKSDLLEYSPCPVGANPNALQNAVKSMGAVERKAISENEDAFKHIFSDEQVADILKSIEGVDGAPEGETREYDCECIDCGHKETSSEHCKDIKCPECGGTMRRAERPGDGQETDAVNDGMSKESIDGLVEEMKVLGAAIKALTDVVRDAKAENPNTPPVAPVEAAGEDLYADAAEAISKGFKIAL